jgi:hypothetical protein
VKEMNYFILKSACIFEEPAVYFASDVSKLEGSILMVELTDNEKKRAVNYYGN